jgi:3-oxoacyl-[acyl-carrier-protein] synthase-3
VDNAELAAKLGLDPAWIREVSGIEQRRFAAPDETVASMGVRAARECLTADVGLTIAASGSFERRFPGPASEIARELGLSGVPAIDLPMASAGGLFGIALAAKLAPAYGNVLVVASEIMSRAVSGRDTEILFGDGAGACLVGAGDDGPRIVDSVLHSDGEFADALSLALDAPLHMDGRTVILQASRKLPLAISEVLERNRRRPPDLQTFILHQANLNLITRVAKSLQVPENRFFCNLQRYGNTSSASLLIALSECRITGPTVLAAFGPGLNWGAVLVEKSSVFCRRQVLLRPYTAQAKWDAQRRAGVVLLRLARGHDLDHLLHKECRQPDAAVVGLLDRRRSPYCSRPETGSRPSLSFAVQNRLEQGRSGPRLPFLHGVEVDDRERGNVVVRKDLHRDRIQARTRCRAQSPQHIVVDLR